MRAGTLVSLIAVLALAAACRRPATPPQPPTWEAAVAQAAETGAAASMPDSAARQEYLEGFRYGARMIHNAIQEHRQPYRIKIGFTPRPPLPAGPLPAGFQVEMPPSVVEMDPETGLPWAAPMGGDGPWAQGAVAGFDWAMIQKIDLLRSQGFLRPRPVPQMPVGEAWRPWPASQAFITVETPNLNYSLRRSEGVLLWSVSGRGFAPVRTWCLAAGLLVDRVAAQDDVLWLNLSSGHALALDRDTGFVRAVVPGVAPPPAVALAAAAPGSQRAAVTGSRKNPYDWIARTREEECAEGRKLAESGDPYGMVCLAHFLAVRQPAEALSWLRKAADKGYTPAMTHLGVAYLEGQFGLKPDKAEARRWIQKAAQAGDVEAKEGLRMLFME